MCRRAIVFTVCVLGLACHTACAAQPVPLPPVKGTKPADPFATVPSGKVSLQRTDGGYLVISNVPGNRFTFQLTGKKIEEIEPKTGKVKPVPQNGQAVKGKDYRQLWAVDGLPLEVITMPLGPGAAPYPIAAEQVLSADQKYEDDYHAKVGEMEIPSARKWLKYASGEPLLYWELKLPRRAGEPPTAPTKRLYANTLSGCTIVRMSATWFGQSEEAKVRRLLVDTMLSLTRYEKEAIPPLWRVEQNIRGEGKVFLISEDLATRDDRKLDNAYFLPPEKLMLVVRIAFELDLRVSTMAFVFDGYKAHVINLNKYDRKTRRFYYTDTTGKKSFLEEGNNRAGVKAIMGPDFWEVSEADLQKVLHAVFLPYYWVRFYPASRGLTRAGHEYGLLKKLVPDSEELREGHLLAAAGLLAEAKEYGPASNLYAVCEALHRHSARATAGLADVFAKVGQPDRAAENYAYALKKLPEDGSLTDAQRRQLAATWESARHALTTKRDQTQKDP